MKTQIVILISLLFAFLSCKKDTNSPTSSQPTAQTKTMLVYMSDIKLNAHFGGIAPMVRITETGTTNESTFLVNTCSNTNGNTFTITYGKSYTVVFGIYIDGQWTQYGSFNGTMTIASDGQISGLIGAGSEIGVAKGTDFQGCGFTIAGEILLFY